jgi:hypothetical protein
MVAVVRRTRLGRRPRQRTLCTRRSPAARPPACRTSDAARPRQSPPRVTPITTSSRRKAASSSHEVGPLSACLARVRLRAVRLRAVRRRVRVRLCNEDVRVGLWPGK